MEEPDIFELFEKLKQTNRVLYNWTNDDSDLELPMQFEEARELSDLILNKPKVVRESLFSKQAYSLCAALEREDYASAGKYLADIKYFAHCFLEDSNLGKDTRTETLRLIAMKS